MSSTEVIDAVVSASTNSLIPHAERSSSSNDDDCMERVNNEVCLWYNKFWSPSINKHCYAHYRTHEPRTVDYQDETPLANTLCSSENPLPRKCPVSPENCISRCSKSELCYFSFKILGKPRYLCDTNIISSFIEPLPPVQLNTRSAMQTSEEMDSNKCNSRCSEGQKCYRMMFPGIVIYHCV